MSFGLLALGSALFAASPTQAAVNLVPAGTVVETSSFLPFENFGIAVTPTAQASAEANLLSGGTTPYADNGEYRYIFSYTDLAPTLTIKLAAVASLVHFGASWFGTDRAPSSVTVSTSLDGINFTQAGVYLNDQLSDGGSDLITSNAIAAQYVRYSFGLKSDQIGGYAPALVSLTATVPEPGTWALMLGGFGLAGVAMRRRASKALSA